MQLNGQHHRSSSVRSLPDALTLKNNVLLQQKLKKELDCKFQQKRHSQQIHRKIQAKPQKRSSSFLHNPLTKPSFSLNDSITHKASLVQTRPSLPSKTKHHNSSRLSQSYRERYNSLDYDIFKTNTHQQQARLSVPSLSLPHSRLKPPPQPHSAPLKSRQQKFKLLIKEQRSHYKSSSQRKISRIDEKIKQLKYRRKYLESLMPQQVQRVAPQKRIPKKYDITQEQFREKIMKMLRMLIRTIELYFNMYQEDHIVGGYFQQTQSFHPRVAHIFLERDKRAKRYTHPGQLTPLFAVYRSSEGRSPFFMEEDMHLYNILNNFLLKLEKNHGNQAVLHNKLQLRSREIAHQQMQASKKQYEHKYGRHEGLNGINQFVEDRLRFDPMKREKYMSDLEKRGVVLNLIERSRELVLREKEKAMNQALLKGRLY